MFKQISVEPGVPVGLATLPVRTFQRDGAPLRAKAVLPRSQGLERDTMDFLYAGQVNLVAENPLCVN
jgi:hypothetical protein